jgi:oligopeptide transport system substrate-binding protein
MVNQFKGGIAMKRRKILCVALALTMAFGTLAGCSTPGGGGGTQSSAQSGTAAKGEKVFRFSINGNPPTMDPKKANSMYTADMTYHLFDGLMRNNCGKVEPAVAESYDVSDDGLTYTFHLRSDAKWSDGKTVTAEDCVYGFQRLVDPATAAPGAYLGEVVKNGKEVTAGKVPVKDLGVSAPDDKTVVVVLATPAPYFPTMLSGAAFVPCRKDLVEKYGKDFAATPDKNVYNGPYQLTEWAQDNKLVLTKNENYWDKDKVKLDKVEISVLTDPNTPIGMYETGKLDYVIVPTSAVDQYRDQAKLYYDGGMSYMQINLKSGNAALANKDFRKALSYGLSRKDLNTMGSAGVPDPTSRLVLPVLPGPTSTFGKDYPFDPYPAAGDTAKAKEYLQKAMSALGVSSPSDLTFKVSYAEGEGTRKIMEILQAEWKKNLGINITLDPVPYAVLYENQAAEKFEMMYTGWVPDYDDPVSYLELFQTGAGYNYSQYSNADYDKYLEAAKTEKDVKKRMDHLFAAEKVVCDDLPIIVLNASRKMALWDDNRIKNFKQYHVGNSYTFIYTDIVS